MVFVVVVIFGRISSGYEARVWRSSQLDTHNSPAAVTCDFTLVYRLFRTIGAIWLRKHSLAFAAGMVKGLATKGGEGKAPEMKIDSIFLGWFISFFSVVSASISISGR